MPKTTSTEGQSIRTPSPQNGLYPPKADLELAFQAVRKAFVPQIPDVVLALRSELTRPEPSIKAAADLIAQDLAISGQILKTINSPLFAGRARIGSVHQAVTLLGIARVTNLVTAEAITRMLSRSRDGAARVVWESIMEQAQASVAIARLTSEIGADEAYLFGLMHDVGSLIFAELLEDYGSEWVLQSATPQSLLEHERRALGVDHATVGFLLSSTWQLPEHTALAIYHHHAPNTSRLEDGRMRALIAMAKLAYYLLALPHGTHETPEMIGYLEEGRQELVFPDEAWAALCDEAVQGHWGKHHQDL